MTNKLFGAIVNVPQGNFRSNHCFNSLDSLGKIKPDRLKTVINTKQVIWICDT